MTRESDVEHRMALAVQWYLGCIRACNLEMMAARKPFNPVHGEIFKCIWNMKDGSLFLVRLPFLNVHIVFFKHRGYW